MDLLIKRDQSLKPIEKTSTIYLMTYWIRFFM